MGLTPEVSGVIITGIIGGSVTLTAAIIKFMGKEKTVDRPPENTHIREHCLDHSGLHERTKAIQVDVAGLKKDVGELKTKVFSIDDSIKELLILYKKNGTQ